MRISKKQFYDYGGFSNTKLYRKANSNGSWGYYSTVIL